ncbi:hypothetical protein V1523DRAFT_422116 [Lipomyces doorenjongii]
MSQACAILPDQYRYFNARSHIVYFTQLFFEALAAKHPGKLSLSHVFPGLVTTPGIANPDLPRWFRIVWPVLSKPFAIPPEESGQPRILLATRRFPANGDERVNSEENGQGMVEIGIAKGTDGRLGSGAYSVDYDGETKNKKRVGGKGRVGAYDDCV